MKRHFWIGIICVVFLFACHRQGGGGCSARRSGLLYDFRDSKRTPQKIPPEEADQLLKRLFPKYLKDIQDCGKDSPANLEASRQLGTFAPSVADKATGSFSGPNLQETVYLVWLNECFASHAENFGTRRLVLVRKDRILMQEEVDEGEILKAVDLDGDGMQELLISGAWGGQGHDISFARLISLSDAHLKVVADFRQVADDACGVGAPDSAVLATEIRYQKTGAGPMPEFQQQNYRALCGPEGAKLDFKPTEEKIEP